MGERELALGQADEFAGLHRGHGQRQRVRIGVADVFAGEDHEPAGEESHVFAPFEHAGEPVDAGVGIAAADAFDQGAGGVVVVVARRIVADGFALDGVGDELAAKPQALGRLGRQHRHFQRPERPAGIAVGDFGQKLERVVVDRDFILAQARALCRRVPGGRPL